MSVVVGVSGPVRGGRTAWWATRLAIARTGAKAVRLTHSRELIQVDALVIGGGSHVDPHLYNQERQPDYRFYDVDRDKFELELLQTAQQQKTPVLAICRGMQLLNVARGGTLRQDAWANVPGDTRNSARAKFTVNILEGTRLASMLGREKVRVNRLHRQSIDTLGSNLRVSARGQGDIVQAIESPMDASTLVGVQWHPEYLPHRAIQQQLFFSLVREAQSC